MIASRTKVASDERRQTAPDPAEAHPGNAPELKPAIEVAPVIRAKIQSPALRSTTLPRERLYARLSEAVRSRVTLLVADAGYGKTTLLTDFSVRSGLRTLWYRLDSTDGDTITWTNYLVAACREISPDFGRGTLNLLRHIPAGEPPRSAFIASFLGELAQLPEAPTLLILDDFHEVDHGSEVREIVARLIDQLPPWVSIVIAARRRPSIEFGRIAGMGELTEIGTDELRFSATETERLFADSYGVPLEADVLQDVDRRTRGWAASLQLFHGSIRGRPTSAVRALARSLSGASSPIYDFLAEEVLDNLPDELNDFLVRISILDPVIGGPVVALFAEGSDVPTLDQARRWIEEADRLGLLTRSSETSDARQLHPLLRDFLLGQLGHRRTADQVRGMHVRVALALVESDPLTACRHYIEAGLDEEAMACLGGSVMVTMGSGQWGVASELIDRLRGVVVDPAVGAIRARHLIEDGDLVGAERLLVALDLAGSTPDVRAVVRQTKLTLGWRTGDNDLLTATLRDMQQDTETPPILRDIAQVFIDASSMSGDPAPLPILAGRLLAMSSTQESAGYDFYSAISLHNASVAFLNCGEYYPALAAASDALAAFDRLSYDAPERFSTQSIMYLCHVELGEEARGETYLTDSLGQLREFADVPAELAIAALALGMRERALGLLSRAEDLRRQGRSDLVGSALTDAARALSVLPANTDSSISVLSKPTYDGPLDLGHTITRRMQLGVALYLGDFVEECLSVCREALEDAHRRGAERAALRLKVLIACSERRAEDLRVALTQAVSTSHLAIHELADVICASLDLLEPLPRGLDEAILSHPDRWLPALRRQLDRGGVPTAHAAARILDRSGRLEDVGRLRAFAKTYGRRGAASRLGVELARRTSPTLRVHDLGPVKLVVDDRAISLSGMRRKPAALLMYLITRPSLAANREQVLDELWPDADPASSSNSLNQSLYFLRREIDPWYEDDVAAGYVACEGDLVSLDSDLVRTDSQDFIDSVNSIGRSPEDAANVVNVVRRYTGHFAPEFEYEEWAISWRSRLRSSLLELVQTSLGELVRAGELFSARDLAIALLAVDPEAADIERRLVWLYWHLGAASAAQAQHDHLVSREIADGLEPTGLNDLVREDF